VKNIQPLLTYTVAIFVLLNSILPGCDLQIAR